MNGPVTRESDVFKLAEIYRQIQFCTALLSLEIDILAPWCYSVSQVWYFTVATGEEVLLYEPLTMRSIFPITSAPCALFRCCTPHKEFLPPSPFRVALLLTPHPSRTPKDYNG